MTEPIKIWGDAYAITRSDQGVIHFDLGEHLPKLAFLDIRAGLSWPSREAPGYYVLIGQQTKKTPRGRNRLLMLSEHLEVNLQRIFEKLTDDAAILHIEDVYTDITAIKGAPQSGFESLFDNFLKEHKLKGPYLRRAPFVEEFEVGLNVVQKWWTERALELIPDSIARQQLGKVPRGPLGSNPEITFFGINALRFVIGSFEKESGNRGMTVEDVRALKAKYGLGAYRGSGPLDL